MQSLSTSGFYDAAEEMVTAIFKEQRGWRDMAIALTPKGLATIPIQSGYDQEQSAERLRADLLSAGAKAYAAAYTTMKYGSAEMAAAEADGRRKLDEVSTVADPEQFESSPDKVLFIFISDEINDRVRAYGITDDNQVGDRIEWLENSASPLHRLLVSVQ